MSDLFSLEGKTAVILGGNSTLARAITEGFVKYGAKIASVVMSPELAPEVEEEVRALGGEIKSFFADVTDLESVQKAADDIQAWAGTIDVLLYAPGVNSSTPFLELDMEEWDKIMAVNLRGCVAACQIFAKKMIEQGTGGSIINISSVSSGPPLSKVFTYSASKAAINNITQYLARELAPYNIRVNAIIPGFFPAEQNRRILTEERVADIMRHTPMKRFGEPRELQGVCLWLASEKASSYVTGSLVRVDGGFGAMTI
ncbi:MAG: SDR family oxidoreductase [Candidatus Wallacebacter cryptica]|nr:SDR family oxidoreductase [Bacillota bacterium]